MPRNPYQAPIRSDLESVSACRRKDRIRARIMMLATSGTCVFLLVLPASLIDMEVPFGIIGASIGAGLGAAVYMRRVTLGVFGAALGALAGTAIAFGYEDGGYGTNVNIFTGHVGWGLGFILALTCLGSLVGLAFRSRAELFGHLLAWPVGALLTVVSAFAWGELRAVHGHELEGELAVGCLAIIGCNVALHRFHRQMNVGSSRLLFWMTWFGWPWLVARTFSLLWLLNHRGGHSALKASNEARVFFAYLILVAVTSNAALTWFRQEKTGRLAAIGIWVAVSTMQSLTAAFFAMSLVNAWF